MVRRLYVPLFLVLLLTMAPKFVLAVVQLSLLGAFLLLSMWTFRHTGVSFSGFAPGVRRLVKSGDRFLVAVLCIVAIYSGLIMSMPVHGPSRQLLLDRFLLNTTFARWSILQPWPALYSAENRVVRFVGDTPPTRGDIDAALAERAEFSIHHPARVTFSSLPPTDGTSHEWHAYHTRLGDTSATALYEIVYTDGGHGKIIRHEFPTK